MKLAEEYRRRMSNLVTVLLVGLALVWLISIAYYVGLRLGALAPGVPLG